MRQDPPARIASERVGGEDRELEYEAAAAYFQGTHAGLGDLFRQQLLGRQFRLLTQLGKEGGLQLAGIHEHHAYFVRL